MNVIASSYNYACNVAKNVVNQICNKEISRKDPPLILDVYANYASHYDKQKNWTIKHQLKGEIALYNQKQLA